MDVRRDSKDPIGWILDIVLKRSRILLSLAGRPGYISRSMPKMRTNFAVMLSDKRSDESTSENRVSQVRKAFNSPFWPFVLATTSIG